MSGRCPAPAAAFKEWDAMGATDASDLKADFLAAMSQAATTVSIVTTDGPAGRFGVTVSAMASVSADGAAPTLLVCVHHRSPAAAAILENGVFCVNVLAAHQAEVSDCFAGRVPAPGGDKFACVEWVEGATGAPRAADMRVAFDCRLAGSHLVGTHHIFIGAVERVHMGDGTAPLIHSGRAYCAPVPLAAA